MADDPGRCSPAAGGDGGDGAGAGHRVQGGGHQASGGHGHSAAWVTPWAGGRPAGPPWPTGPPGPPPVRPGSSRSPGHRERAEPVADCPVLEPGPAFTRSRTRRPRPPPPRRWLPAPLRCRGRWRSSAGAATGYAARASGPRPRLGHAGVARTSEGWRQSRSSGGTHPLRVVSSSAVRRPRRRASRRAPHLGLRPPSGSSGSTLEGMLGLCGVTVREVTDDTGSGVTSPRGRTMMRMCPRPRHRPGHRQHPRLRQGEGHRPQRADGGGPRHPVPRGAGHRRRGLADDRPHPGLHRGRAPDAPGRHHRLRYHRADARRCSSAGSGWAGSTGPGC